jgi:transcriptional regulator with XRE-family HTH domain
VSPHPNLTQAVAATRTLSDLGGVLRQLRRRHGRQHPGGPLTYRELAAKLGYSHGSIGEYLAGNVLPPVDRFDALVALLGATPSERGLLATARDAVEDRRRVATVRPARRPRNRVVHPQSA